MKVNLSRKDLKEIWEAFFIENGHYLSLSDHALDRLHERCPDLYDKEEFEIAEFLLLEGKPAELEIDFSDQDKDLIESCKIIIVHQKYRYVVCLFTGKIITIEYEIHPIKEQQKDNIKEDKDNKIQRVIRLKSSSRKRRRDSKFKKKINPPKRPIRKQ